MMGRSGHKLHRRRQKGMEVGHASGRGPGLMSTQGFSLRFPTFSQTHFHPLVSMPVAVKISLALWTDPSACPSELKPYLTVNFTLKS